MPRATDVVTVLADPPMLVEFARIGQVEAADGTPVVDDDGDVIGLCIRTTTMATPTSPRSVSSSATPPPTRQTEPDQRHRRDRGDHAPSDISWRRFGGDHRPPPRLGALDVGLLVGDGRRPPGRTQPVVGDHPRLRVYGCNPGGIGPRWNRQRRAADDLAHPLGQRQPGRSPVSARTRSPGIQPSGATLYTPSRRSLDREHDGRRRGRRGAGTAAADRPRRSA